MRLCTLDPSGLGQITELLQVRNVLLTVALFCGPMLITFSFLNTVAIAYHSTAALPFGTICVIFVLWALITFPLTVVGGIAGKNSQVSCAVAVKTALSACYAAVCFSLFSTTVVWRLPVAVVCGRQALLQNAQCCTKNVCIMVHMSCIHDLCLTQQHSYVSLCSEPHILAKQTLCWRL